jgi:hypothetical protein
VYWAPLYKGALWVLGQPKCYRSRRARRIRSRCKTGTLYTVRVYVSNLKFRAKDTICGQRSAIGVALILTGAADHDLDTGNDHPFLALRFPNGGIGTTGCAVRRNRHGVLSINVLSGQGAR